MTQSTPVASMFASFRSSTRFATSGYSKLKLPPNPQHTDDSAISTISTPATSRSSARGSSCTPSTFADWHASW